MYPCVCCGHLSQPDGPGSDEICPICFWQDDSVQLRWPDFDGGANKACLRDAQQLYPQLGAVEQRLVPFTRLATSSEPLDPAWRPIDVRDRFEECGVQCRPWPDDPETLYWWRPTFWAPTQN